VSRNFDDGDTFWACIFTSFELQELVVDTGCVQTASEACNRGRIPVSFGETSGKSSLL